MTDNQTEALPDMSKYIPKDIPIESIVEYRSRGMSYNEIATLTGCTKSNVIQRLQTVNAQIDALPNYKKHRADVIALTGRRILSHLTQDKLKAASAYQLTGMYGILYDKERLEREQSTANISIRMATIAALQREIEDK